MKQESNRASVEALKNMLSEIDLIISTTVPLPENRTERCRELITGALALTDDLSDAVGHNGGRTTARRHVQEHHRRMAQASKKEGGGGSRKGS
jgi:hypothetical protein